MIHLDYRDSRPIYEQVKDSLRRLMVTGVLAPGDKLPSVRSMASQLSINPNTIQRAYAELEAEGYIYSVPGKGSFAAAEGESEGYVVSVTGKGSFVAEGDTQNAARKAELTGKLKPILEELRSLGMTHEELMQLWEGEKK